MREVVSIFISLLFVGLCLTSVALSSPSLPKDPFLGISPQDEKYYKTSSEIKCKDGSKKFRKSQLNDDFCDCPDGSDEPGTSACPNGKFYCRNAGHSPLFLFSSRVNDGICDCCDGSDEYGGKVKCPNTCWEAGKVARDNLKQKIATYKEGFELRKQEIEQAKIGLVKDEADLKKLKSEEKILKGLVEQLKDRKEQIEKAEEKERLQREKEEKERKEAELAAQPEKGDIEDKKHSDEKVAGGTNNDENVLEGTHDVGMEKVVGSEDEDVIGKSEDFPSEQEPTVEVSDVSEESTPKAEDQHTTEAEEEILSAKEETPAVESPAGDAEKKKLDKPKEVDSVSEKNEELSREELGRLVASRWTGEKNEKQFEEADSPKDSDQEDDVETSKNLHDDEDDGFVSDADDDTSDAGKYDDHDAENDADDTYEEEYQEDSSSSYKSDVDDDVDLSDTTTTNPSWLEKIQRTVKNILQAVNIFQTPVDKSEADLVRKEYDESSTKLSKIQSKISSLEKKLKKDFGPEKQFYSFYGHCFENKQNKYTYKVCPFKEASQVEGYSTTRLGQWDKFENSYQVMVFSNGDKCWNGPDRSMKVKLRCGLKNEVMDVDEPSRCEYVAVLSTPAHCLENKLKELQQKLDQMNQELPEKHDEL